MGLRFFDTIRVDTIQYRVTSLFSTRSMRRQTLLLASLGLMTLWRLALLPTLGLSPEEAFTAMRAALPFSADFSLHGPLPVWLARLGMMIGGHEAFGLRLFAPLLALGTSVLAWQLARAYYDQAVAGWTVVILNLLPAFNLAAASWTPAGLLFFLLTALPWCLRRAFNEPRRWHWSWAATGGCLAGVLLTAPGLAIVLPVCAALLYRPRAHRFLLRHPAFWTLVVAPAVVVFCLWLGWQAGHEWPLWDNGRWRPDLWLIPGWFRWLVLVSPLLFVVMLWAVRAIWQRPSAALSAHSLLIGYALPLAVADFFWFTRAPWPDAGCPAWMVFAAMITGWQFITSPLLQTEDRVSWRTITLVLAALQSVFLLNSDYLRTSIGLPWRFEQRLDREGSLYLHLFTRDPSGALRGWRQSGRLLGDVLIDTQLKPPTEGRYFVIAADWRLAAALNQALPADAPCHWPAPDHPRVHTLLDPGDWSHPFTRLPRYDARADDGSSPYEGRDALFVSDDPTRRSPPPVLRAAFARTELLSVAQVVHAGHVVRELKIFACYDYRPPQL